MKIKKIFLLSGISLLALAPLASCTDINPFKPHTEKMSVTLNSAKPDLDTLPGLTETEQAEYEFNGIKYTKQETTSVASAVANPQTVSVITLDAFGNSDLPVDFSTLDLSGYTSLTTVILMNYDLSASFAALKTIPQPFTLYVSGKLTLTSDLAESNCEHIVLTTRYDFAKEEIDGLKDEEQINILKTSGIKSIANVTYNHRWYNSLIAELKTQNIQNKNTEAIEFKEITEEDLPYSVESFNPSSYFKTEDTILGSKNHPYFGLTENTDDFYSNIHYVIDELDSRVDRLVITKTTIKEQFENINIDTLVLKYPKSIPVNANITNLIIGTTYLTTFNFADLPNLETLTLYPATTGGEAFTEVLATAEQVSNLKQIKIPAEYADTIYKAFKDNTAINSKIVTFDHNTERMPTYSTFKSVDQNSYSATGSYDIDDLETALMRFKMLGYIPDLTKTITSQILAKDIPITVSSEPNYTARDFDRIYITRNIDPVKVIENMKELLMLEDGYLATSGELPEVTFGFNRFSYGEDGIITLYFNFPDGSYLSKDISVKYLEGEHNYATLSDGDDNMYILHPTTDNAPSLESLLFDTFESYYLYDATYQPAASLNFAIDSYNQASTYTSSRFNGEIRVRTVENLDISFENVDVPVIPDDSPLEDESDLLNGYQIASNIYYAGTYSEEDILKAISKYLAWENGVLLDDPNIKVKINLKGDQLSIFLEKNSEIIASSGAQLIKLDNDKLGNVIYASLAGTAHGVLITDIDDNPDVDLGYLYKYLAVECDYAIGLPEVEIPTFNYKTPTSVTIDSFYKHNNGKFYHKYLEVKSVYFEDLVAECQAEVTITPVMSPDDDLEDPESDYAVKTIDKIYIPQSLNGTKIPGAIVESLVTYLGERYTGSSITFTTSNNGNVDNTIDYTILMFGTLPDGIWYEHQIDVEIIPASEMIAYVVLSDGTIVAVTPLEKTTKESIQTGLENFIKTHLDIASPNVTLSESIRTDITETYTGSTYQNGSVEVVVSGLSALLFSTAENPIPLEESGYHYLTTLTFTNNYKLEDVIKAVSNYILTKDGMNVSNYTIEAKILTTMISFDIYLGEEKLSSFMVTYKTVDTGEYGPFILISELGKFNSTLLLEKRANSDKTVAEVYNYIMQTYMNTYALNSEFSLDFNTKGIHTEESVIQAINNNYYESKTQIRIVDLEEEIANNCLINDLGSAEDDGESIVDKVKDFFKDNKAMQITSMVFGTIFGILLIYGCYVSIRKIIKWLKH